MIRSFSPMAFGLLAILGAALFCKAVQACSQEEIWQLRNLGYSSEEIRRICTQQYDYRPAPQQVPIARFCVTAFGSCAMGQPIPIGSSCFCPSMYGPIWGVAQ